MKTISNNDIEALRNAKNILENPSFIIKFADYFSKPVELIIEQIPINKNKLNLIVKKALYKSLDIAICTINKEKHASSLFNKALVGTSGATIGYFGLPALAIELPISTTIIFREVANIAQREGFNLSDIETRLNCMEVFALGGHSKDDEKANSAYYRIRMGFAYEVKKAMDFLARGVTDKEILPLLVKMIETIATRYGIVVSEKAMVQSIPYISSGFGATINLVFINHFQDMAQGHFTIKRLEKKYGEDKIRNVYLRV